ncbi:unnamed protein product (macronuclear) [Paramecium tetraurelia]|uniref:Tetratricopeptide repeat protein n=1 Tax=Paramecium tetraurelia TaxID=5888 RepID=A0BM76_PARTE|nr:uncharacterized protein GSPATT00030277001 [Paramecium tetraurelia]CAK59643.1 unnamed protein product [Paramecium tetraurelia]|eukprot:XP_001427041.1 hypothetical protein (macronuclear) [Paramecium tetraurelia strain d4-2]
MNQNFTKPKVLIDEQIHLARILNQLDLQNEVIDAWEQGIQNNKNDFTFYHQKVCALKSQKRYDEIIKCYDQGIMFNKTDPIFYAYKCTKYPGILIVVELEKQNRLEEAIQVWEFGIQNNKTDPYFYKQKVQALIQCYGETFCQEKIVECWDFAIQNGNDTLFYIKSKVSALEKLERWDEVIKCLNHGIHMHRQVQIFYEDKGKLNRLEEIIECWDEGMKNNPNTSFFYKKKFQALEEQEKIEQIIEEANHYIDLFDDMIFYEAKSNQNNSFKARCLFKQGKFEEIIQCWDKGIKKNNTISEFYIKKIEALEIQGRWVDSIQCCDEWISKTIWNTEAIIKLKGSFNLQFSSAFFINNQTIFEKLFSFHDQLMQISHKSSNND